MKKIKFSVLFVVLIAVAAMMSVHAFAATKEIANVVGDFEVEGTPNSALKIGSGYEVRVISQGNTSVMQFSFADTSREPVIISNALSDGKSFVKWNGLTFSWPSGTNTWIVGQYATFDIIDDTSDTTIASSNIKLIDYNKKKVKEGHTISPTFEVVDYNVNWSEVDKTVKPYLTGYSSNESFALTSNNIDIELVDDPPTGKMTFRITLPLRYTGVGSRISFTVAYPTIGGSLRIVDCTTSIPNTVETEEDEDEDEEEKRSDDPTPYIIVDSYDYGGTSVTAGEDFELKLRLRNTSTANSLQNIVMSVSPMGVFSMTSSSNTMYIERLLAGSIIEKTITIKAGLTKVTDDEDANSIDIKFTYQYGIEEDEVIKLQSGTSSESITLPVDFPDRFELGVPEFDSRAFAGEEVYLSVPMINKGRSSVYNLAAYIRGDMANPGQNQYIGNLDAGTESSADFSVIFDEPGTHKGEIVVTYEDTNMNPKEVVAEFSLTVSQMQFDEPEIDMDMPMEEPVIEADTTPKEDKTKPIKIALALLVCSMSAYSTIAKAKAKRSIYLDENI